MKTDWSETLVFVLLIYFSDTPNFDFYITIQKIIFF